MKLLRGFSPATTADYLALAVNMKGLQGKQGMNVLLWGPTGSGKSALTEAVARQYGREPVEFVLGVIEPEDVGGLPIPGAGDSFVRQVDLRLQEAALPGRLLLFDDFTSAPPAVQAATLRVILEREVAGIDLSRTPVVATANALADGGLQPILAAVANRFLHLRIDGADVLRHLNREHPLAPDGSTIVSRLDLDALNRRFEEAEEMAWRHYRPFLELAPEELLHRRPPAAIDGPEEAAYPSHRTWEMAVRSTAACWAVGIDPKPMVIGCVGSRAYGALVAKTSPLARKLTPGPRRPLLRRRAPGTTPVADGPGNADYLAVAATVQGLNGVSGLPVVAWGGVGTGKSSMARAVLEQLGYRQRTIVLGTWMPTDLGGIPIPARDGPSFRRQVDPVIKEVAQPGWGLIIDDLTFASPAVQNAALDLILRRRAGSVDLAGTPIIVTANPLSSGGLNELTPSMANRLLHLEVDGGEAKRYLLGDFRGGAEFLIKPDKLRRDFQERLAMAEATVMQFLRSRPADLQRRPETDRPDGGHDYAHATPRTWELAARALAGCEVAGIPALPLLCAALGEEVGSLFAQWDREHPLPTPSEVFAGSVEWNRLRPDEALAAAKAAAMVAETSEEIEALMREGRRCQHLLAPDIFAPAYRVLRSRVLDAKLPFEHAFPLGVAIREMADAIGIR